MASKNSDAIENVGKEINQEIEYMNSVAKQYKRTQKIKKEKKKLLQNYKGIICLPLGKQDNIQDFKEFLYQEYIPMLNNLQIGQYENEALEKVKEDFENKCKQVKDYEQLIHSFNYIKNNRAYFYGIDIESSKEDENENKAKIQKIQKLFLEDKKRRKNSINDLKNQKDILLEQKKTQKEELENINKNINARENAIKNSHQKIVMENNNIQNLKNQQEYFERINKSIFTKILNFREYRKYKNTDFFYKINEIEVANKIEEQKISQQIKDKSKLEIQKDKIQDNYDKLNKKYEDIEIKYNTLKKDIKEMVLIEEFNKKDKKTYWNYSNIIEMYGKSTLNELNQELFELALKLNEAYIIKNSEEISNNLKLFLPDNESLYMSEVL